MMNRRKLRWVALFLVMALLATTAKSLWVSAATKSELEQKLEDLEAQEKAIKNSISNTKSDLNDSQKRKELLDSQIDNVTDQIELLEQQLAAVNKNMADKSTEIAAAETAIAEKEAAIKSTHQELGQRLRRIAKSGNLSSIQRLLNTENYKEYLLKAKAAACIARRDQQTMDDLEAALEDIRQQKTALEQQKTDIEAQKQELQKLKKSSDSKKKQLDTLYAAARSEERKLQSNLTEYNNKLAATQKKIDEANAAIEELITQSQSHGSYNDSNKMFWPVPTVRAISSHYGPRWGTMHRGMDIANGPIPIYGENIVAAADGVVIAANYTSKWGSGWSYGYGYSCIVDHGTDSKGRKIHTLYAHCSKLFARVGQKVVGGQTVLGQAGNTGDVTGPHLHFEVRVDGARVNPYPTYVHPNYN